MEYLGNGNDHAQYELPAERAEDDDVVMMSTGKPVLKKDMKSYQDAFVPEHDGETHGHTLDVAVATGGSVAIGLAIFAYVRHQRRNQ